MKKGWNISINDQAKDKEKNSLESLKVSIIIACRNEEKNLKKLFQSINQQTYNPQNIEIIFVDDYSIDNSPEIIREEIQVSKFKIQIIELSKIIAEEGYKNHNKKIAISKGIESSIGDLIICTDADVWLHPEWLKTVIEKQEMNQAQFMTGPVLFPPSNSIWKQFLEFDQINNIALAAASIGIGNASMCNGANMAFTRQAWNEARGYQGIEDKPSGDDMMLMHRIQKLPAAKISFIENKNSMVWTESVHTFSEFIDQRVRWFSKIFQYENSSVMIGLGLGYVYHLGIIFSLLASLKNIQFLFLLILPKIIIDSWFLLSPLNFYSRDKLVLKLPIFSILTSFYIAGIGSIALFYPYKWKRR